MEALFVVAGRLPFPTGNGVSVLWNGLIECFHRVGARVTVVPAAIAYPTAEEEAVHEAYVRRTVARFVDIPPLRKPHRVQTRGELLRRAILPREADFFPRDAEGVRALHRLASESAFDVVVGCDWAALSLTHDLPVPLRVASIVDPVRPTLGLRLRALRRLSYRKRAVDLLHLLSERRVADLADDYLRDHALILEHAHHHAVELERRGFAGVHYLPHPIVPPRPITPRPNPDPIRVLMIGSLKGTASRSGFEFLARELLPRLTRDPPKRPYVIRIVGHGDMDPRVREELAAWPQVEIVGYADDVDAEFRASDFVLVTIPSRFGFRTRIAESFGYGACVVAHGANCAGMPEVFDDRNALTSEDPDGLARRFVRAVDDAELRARIGAAALSTFLREYSIDGATKKVRQWVEAELARAAAA